MQNRTTTDGRDVLIADSGSAGPRAPRTPAALRLQPESPTAGVRLPRFRCEEFARRGTGVGTCDLPLDVHGRCDRAGNHLEVL